MRFDCIHCRKATTKPQSVKGAFLRMLTLGDCIYREGTHYTQHFKFNFDYKYDLHNNCTEYRNTITINGNFDSEVVYRYEINYK